jgi:TetR/AcrR family transcriptional regulator, regulator of cefoperazone and chloramphenicol sensitivity
MSTIETDTTRERITTAAGEIFAERGFDGTTVREICQRAGANVAAVNYYFGDKQRLYVEAVCQAHRWRMEQFPLPPWTDDGTFVLRVRSGPGATWHSKLMMREMANPTAACAELVQSSIRPQFEILLQILRELTSANAPQEELRLIAFSIVGQCLFYHFADPVIRNLLTVDEYASLDVNQLSKHITDFSLAAIRSFSRLTGAGAIR